MKQIGVTGRAKYRQIIITLFINYVPIIVNYFRTINRQGPLGRPPRRQEGPQAPRVKECIIYV